MQLYRGVTIRLLPTPKQENLFWRCAGVARWSYNYFLSENQRTYKETGKGISANELRKTIKILKKTTHPWLKEVSNKIIHTAIKEAGRALIDFFKGTKGYPKFKAKYKSQPKFYTRDESLRKVPGGFKGEKLGFIRTTKPLPDLPSGQKFYINPRIKYDGKYWYLAFCIKVESCDTELTDEKIGIDLGIKELAVLSNGKVYHNINKSRRVKQLKKRLKREQRKLSRKIEAKIDHYITTDKLDKNGNPCISRKPVYKTPLRTCKNFVRQSNKINLIYRKLTNIRDTYIHTVTAEIVKTKPQIVIEDLNVSGMMKNKYLSDKIKEQKWYGFRCQLAYKCEYYGIKLVIANRKYPSSKLCSLCSHKKVDLKLSDRIYKCSECGLVIDRDLNAAINLMNYQI